jgi:hypothetical protein
MSPTNDSRPKLTPAKMTIQRTTRMATDPSDGCPEQQWMTKSNDHPEDGSRSHKKTIQNDKLYSTNCI